jgi:hypothetical protein
MSNILRHPAPIRAEKCQYPRPRTGSRSQDVEPVDACARERMEDDEIWGGPGEDLIDCAYVASRDKGEDYAIAHTVLDEDTVVDGKTVVYDDTSQ